MIKFRNNNLCPISCDEYVKLLAFIEKHDGNVSKTKNILWQIGAPGQLYLLLVVLENVHEIIRYIQVRNPIILLNSNASDWMETLQFILDRKQKIIKEVGNHLFFPKLEDMYGKHDFHGLYLTSHPFYSMLINMHQSDRLKPDYKVLQAQLLAAHSKLIIDHTSIDAFEASVSANSLLGPLNSGLANATRLMFDLTLDINQKDFNYLQRLHFQRTRKL